MRSAQAPTRRGEDHAAQSWTMIAGFLFGALRLNALLVFGALPLVLLCVLAASPLSAPPALVLALYLAMPIITVGFGAFRDAPVFRVGDGPRSDPIGTASSWWDGAGDQELLRPALRMLRVTAPRVLRATALPMGAALVLVVDVQWALGRGWGLMVVPALLVAALLALMTAFAVCALVSEGAEAPGHVLARAAAVGLLRSPLLTLLSAVTLGTGLLGVIWQPILCWALASSLVLYVVWAGARWAVRPVLRSR